MKYYLYLILLLLNCYGCKSEQPTDTNNDTLAQPVAIKNAAKSKAHQAKFGQNYPSEHFTIDPTKDTILISTTGTLFFLSKNTFVDEQNNILEVPVELDWQEMNTLEDALKHNLTTVDDKGQILQTGGMFWLGATFGNGQLAHAKEPIRIEKQSPLAMPNLKQYEALWQGDDMVWGKPKELPKDMTLIDLKMVEASLEMLQKEMGSMGWNKVIVDEQPQKILTQDYKPRFGFDCKIIELQQLLNRDPEFKAALSQTWIATQEFRKRLWALVYACSDKGFKLYLENTDKKLWEVDEMVVELLTQEGNAQAETFRNFAAMKNTVVRGTIPLPKELLQKIEAVEQIAQQINAEAAFFKYPITIACQPNEYLNIDQVISYEAYKQIEQERYIDSAQWQVNLKNCPPNSVFQVFAVLKGGNALIRLEPIKNRKVFKLGYKVAIPQGYEILFIVKDEQNEYVDAVEAVQTEQELTAQLVPKPMETSIQYQTLLNKYMQVSEKLCFSNQKQDGCCGATYPK